MTLTILETKIIMDKHQLFMRNNKIQPMNLPGILSKSFMTLQSLFILVFKPRILLVGRQGA